jgi:hypothetical protein
MSVFLLMFFLLGILIFFVVKPAAKKVIYSFDFSSDSAKAGWVYKPSKWKGKKAYIKSEGLNKENGEMWTSPKISLPDRPFGFYRLQFQSKAEAKGYYAIFYYDSNDKFAVDDNYGTVDKSAEWVQNDVIFRARTDTKTITINFINKKPVSVKDLSLWTISIEEAASHQDRLYATLPPLDFNALTNRWKYLPKTMEALKKGKVLRIVMLGDSIINDTNNSNWDALLSRLYPKAKIQLICSARNSTGCRYYYQDENFKSYVKDPNPDLLIIGGISNGYNVKHLKYMRIVIEKAREHIGCEIMVISGPVSSDVRKWDKNNPDQALPQQVPSKELLKLSPFYQEMEEMCKEMKVEYLDMYTPWHQYIGASGKPYMWFHRDIYHANDQGKQILGRMLEGYFSPKENNQ